MIKEINPLFKLSFLGVGGFMVGLFVDPLTLLFSVIGLWILVSICQGGIRVLTTIFQ